MTRETLDVTVLCHRESREAGERSHFVIERSLSSGEIPGCARDDKQQYSRLTPHASQLIPIMVFLHHVFIVQAVVGEFFCSLIPHYTLTA